MHNIPNLSLKQSSAKTSRTLASAVGAAIVCSVLIGQRFAVSVGNGEVQLCQFVVLAGLGVLAVAGALRVHMTRLLLFSIFVFGVLWSPLFNPNFSALSLLNVLIIYGTFVFCVEEDENVYAAVLDWVHRCMLIISVLAILQFAIQLISSTYIDLSTFLDARFTLDGFNSFYAISPGLNKSNGVFLLEPSFLSQFSAVALILELLGARRLVRLSLYSGSLVLSFGGTGLLLLLFIAIPVFRRLPRKYKYLSVLGGSLILTWYFTSTLGESVLGRISEFNSEGSSADIRFTGAFRELGFLFDQEMLSIMLGHGPGNSPSNSIFKVVYEYGLLGTATYLAFLLYCFFSDTRSTVVSWALLFMHLFLSGGFIGPHTLYFFYAILMFVPSRSRLLQNRQSRISPSYSIQPTSD